MSLLGCSSSRQSQCNVPRPLSCQSQHGLLHQRRHLSASAIYCGYCVSTLCRYLSCLHTRLQFLHLFLFRYRFYGASRCRRFSSSAEPLPVFHDSLLLCCPQVHCCVAAEPRHVFVGLLESSKITMQRVWTTFMSVSAWSIASTTASVDVSYLLRILR